MNDLAKGMILPGSLLIEAGPVPMLFPKVTSPGDLLIKRENFSFPLAASVVVSILISLVLSLIGRFR